MENEARRLLTGWVGLGMDGIGIKRRRSGVSLSVVVDEEGGKEGRKEGRKKVYSQGSFFLGRTRTMSDRGKPGKKREGYII